MPTYVCPCGQRFKGKGLAGSSVVCSKCGLRSKIPGPAPEPALLSSDLLDELEKYKSAENELSSSASSTSADSTRLPTSLQDWQTPSVSINWNRFIPVVVGAVLLLMAGGVAIISGPTWWKMATTWESKRSKPAKETVNHGQTTEPSWRDTYFNDSVYALPSEVEDHPTPPQAKSGVQRDPNAHPVEQGMELQIDVSKYLSARDSPTYILLDSALTGATIDPQSGLLQWKAPLDFPPSVHEVLVKRTFADERSDLGMLFKVQVMPSIGPPPRVGMLAPEPPLQTDTSRKPFKFRGSTIHPLADYSLTAVVLSSKFYTAGEEAYVSPLDLALGWGCMSDESMLRRLQISQAQRRYSYTYSGNLNADQAELNRSAANVHIIPSTEEVAELLASVKRGDVVRLTGALVEVKRQYWSWKSSLTREDGGDGACEVMWVDQAEILEK